VYAANNPYRAIQTEVLDVSVETPTIKTLTLKPEGGLEFRTGQFIELTVPGCGEAPFTPSSRPSVSETIQVSVMRVGKVTSRIHAIEPGATVGVRGPFGEGYPMGEFRGRDVIVVGGGCGFAPLRSLMYTLFSTSGDYKSLHFRGGCRNPKEFLYRGEIEGWAERDDLDLVLTVDEGDESWSGHVGLVTTILDGSNIDIPTAVAIVCGPPVMMKFATARLLELGFGKDQLYLSMEKNMSCGFGKCGHCRLGPYYTCKDGPVFRYDRICDLQGIWD
jgi:NAD(P)H-flavin reductase